MFTRQQYMNGECSFSEFFKQLVEESNAMEIVQRHFSVETIRKEYTKDKYLNGIKLIVWDILGVNLKCNFEKFGECRVPSTIVCVLKRAAKMMAGIEE